MSKEFTRLKIPFRSWKSRFVRRPWGIGEGNGVGWWVACSLKPRTCWGWEQRGKVWCRWPFQRWLWERGRDQCSVSLLCRVLGMYCVIKSEWRCEGLISPFHSWGIRASGADVTRITWLVWQNVCSKPLLFAGHQTAAFRCWLLGLDLGSLSRCCQDPDLFPQAASPGPACRGLPCRWREPPRLLRDEKWIEKSMKQNELDGISILECGNQWEDLIEEVVLEPFLWGAGWLRR